LPHSFFLESSWSSTGNRQHLNYNVARGEQLLLDNHRAVAEGPTGPTTLLIVIYDAAASTSSPGHRYPDDSIGEYGFDFTCFGPRWPTRLG
jgi:phospholipase C